MDTTKIGIVKTDRKNGNAWSEKWRCQTGHAHQHIREVFIDGELRGTFNPADNDWYLLDISGEHIHITESTSITGRNGVEFEGRWIGYATRARSIADMEFIVRACLELDRIPDQRDMTHNMTTKDLGSLHLCAGCGGNFYDMGKLPPTCPRCNWRGEPGLEPQTPEPQKKATKLRRKQRDLLALLLAQPAGVEPNYYTGSGRWTQKGPDYVVQLRELLTERGLVRGRHFQIGNRAPRGGYEGDFIRLTPAGRRLQAIKRLAQELGQ